MSDTVTMPLWAVVILALLAAWGVVSLLLLPLLRGMMHRRSLRVLDGLDGKPPARIEPFKLSRRQTLIDRLMCDPEVVGEMERYASENNLRRDRVREKVRRYAGEIVPSFNAYAYFRIGYRLARWLARMMFRVRIGYVDQPGLTARPQSIGAKGLGDDLLEVSDQRARVER